MGSITEEELIQMVRDFLESETTPQISKPHPLTNHYQTTHFDTLKEMLWRATDEEVEVLEKVTMYMRNIGSSREPKNLSKWLALRLKMDGYEASLCKTSWIIFHGDYEFVDVVLGGGEGKEKSTLTRLVVDVDFRSHFELARPTLSYTKLVDSLPSVFVGSEEKLGNVVSLLCSAAKQSLKENGLHVPPWRKASFILSKWNKIPISPCMGFKVNWWKL